MKKWVTLGFLWLAIFFYMTDRHLFGLLVIPIQREIGLTDIQVGFIDMVMFWVLAVMMPITGMIGDRYPRKRLIAISIVLWAVFTALTGCIGGFVSALLLRSILTPAVQSLYSPSSNALIAAEHRATRTFALASHQGALYLGLISSGAIVAALLAAFGQWRYVFFAFGAMTLVVGILFTLVFWRKAELADTSQKKDLVLGMKAFFANPAALCASAGFVALVFVTNATASWAPKFVAQKFALSVGEAGRCVMLWPNVAAMLAIVGSGILTDRFVGRYPRFRLGLQIASLVVGAPLLVLFGFAPSVVTVWIVLIAWGVVRGTMQSNNYASVFDVIPPACRASAVGFMSVFASLVGSLAPLSVGMLSHRYGVRGFEIAFSAMGLLLVAAAIVMAWSYRSFFHKYRVEE